MWTFARKDDAGSEIGTFETRPGLDLHLIADGGILIVPTAPQDETSILGIANVGPWGVKLRAVGTSLKVTPQSPPNATNAGLDAYTLQPQADGKTEIILLRANDSISSLEASGRLVLVWKAPQVQVNSSVTDGEIPESEDQQVQGDASNPEEETEDDEDLDRTVVTAAVQPSNRSTPFLSASREVVQETPTVGRVQDLVDRTTKASPSPAGSGNDSHRSEEPFEETEVNLTMPAKRHPTLKIPAKRASPDTDDNPKSNIERSAKRTKTAGDRDSTVTTPAKHFPVRKTAAKPKKRLSDIEREASTPSRSQRSSQRSSRDDGETYDGPTPRVAFSNSAIPESGKSALKFLKNKGAYVDAISDDCNILCVKDGTLVKTMKLLQAIALGIPIVTDKWLLSSAKVNRFLPLSQFIPSAPAQEKEWNFLLADIWNKPQNTLLTGYTIRFTPKLKQSFKPFSDIENVCKAAGARRVVHKKAGGKDVDSEDTIVLAAEQDDLDAKALVESGRACFSKDFLTNSILRGQVDRESDEFRINITAKPVKKGRGRTS